MRDLLWELFLMVREIEPATPAHTKRQQEWAAKFHELEAGDDKHEAVHTADHDEDEDEGGDDPHAHGVPARSRPPRKKR